jgi:hypothetical protein
MNRQTCLALAVMVIFVSAVGGEKAIVHINATVTGTQSSMRVPA